MSTNTLDKVAKLLKQLEDSPVKDLRVKAAWELGKFRKYERHIIPALVKTLKDDYWKLRSASAEALGMMRGIAIDAVPALIEALNDDFRKVRASAAEALGRIGKKVNITVEALKEALKDDDPYVQAAVSKALEKIGPIKVSLEFPTEGPISKHKNKGREVQTIYLAEEKAENYLEENCRICNMKFRLEQIIAICPYCNALYHKDHLEQWLLGDSICPVCKKEIH